MPLITAEAAWPSEVAAINGGNHPPMSCGLTRLPHCRSNDDAVGRSSGLTGKLVTCPPHPE